MFTALAENHTRIFLKHMGNEFSWGVFGWNVTGTLRVEGVSLYSTSGMGFRADFCEGTYELIDSDVSLKPGTVRPMRFDFSRFAQVPHVFVAFLPSGVALRLCCLHSHEHLVLLTCSRIFSDMFWLIFAHARSWFGQHDRGCDPLDAPQRSDYHEEQQHAGPGRRRL